MVNDSIYNSQWYASDVPVRKYVLLVMMRAQMAIYFTANGFSKIDREMIIFVCCSDECLKKINLIFVGA